MFAVRAHVAPARVGSIPCMGEKVAEQAGHYASLYACGEVELRRCEETDRGHVGMEERVQAGVDLARRGVCLECLYAECI